MPVSRRSVVFAALAVSMPRLSMRARLRPGLVSAIGFTPLPQERLAFHATGITGAIVLPVARATIRAVLPLVDREVALLSFAADPDPLVGVGATLDIAAIVGWDGAALRLLAIEILAWRADASPNAAPGARMNTRIAATGDRLHLRLQRDAAATRGGLVTRRESWTDLLAWRDGAALADAAPRPPLAGTWQHRLADDRARMMARLGQQRKTNVADLAALCGPPDLAIP